MCLFISIEASHDARERLVAAAEMASRCGIRIDVGHASRWPWSRERPALAKLTEDGDCSCSLLADDADWNAATWSLRAEVVPAIAAALRVLLVQGPPGLRISALWAGSRAEHVEHLDSEQLLALVADNRLGTKTAYVVAPVV